MILDVDVVKHESCVYELVVSITGRVIGDPSIHASVFEALDYVGKDWPDGLTDWANVHFQAVSAGVHHKREIARNAPQLAQRLVEIDAKYRADHG